jgi:PilZ domain
MMVDVPVAGRVGDRPTTYFRDFGKLDGCISDAKPGCFLLELDMTLPMRQRFANKLTWLEEKRKDPEISDLRRDVRMIPATPHSTLALADGTVHECFVIDISASGVAVSAPLQPELGTPLAVGTCVGRVIRLLPDGFAVKFVAPQNHRDLDRLIARPTALLSAGGASAEPLPDRAGVGQVDA